MNETTNRTGSAKIDRLIERAEKLGLEVEVRVEVSKYGSRTVDVDIQRPRLDRDPANLLEQMQQADRVSLGWSWPTGNGRTPKLYWAKRQGLGSSRDLSIKVIPYTIDGLADR